MAPLSGDFNGVHIAIEADTPKKATKALKDVTAKEAEQLRKALDAKFPQPSTKEKLNKMYGKNSAEKQQEVREKNLLLYGSETAKACYEQANDKDKTYLRKITRYEKGSMVLLNTEGKELFRSYGIIEPLSLLGTKSFKKNTYNTGVNQQQNIEAYWSHLFDAPNGAPKGVYNLRADVMKASGIDANITAGNISQWETIYKLFSPVHNNSGSEEISGMQIARQVMGITGWIWTNEKTSSVSARKYGLGPELCSRFDYNIGNGNMSVVGLENLQPAK